MRRALFSALAVADLVAALALFRFAVDCWKSGLKSENAGFGLLGLVVFGLGAVTVGISVGVLVVAMVAHFRGNWINSIVVVAGLAPPALVAPFALDAFRRSTTRLTLSCSNLHRNDPLREVGIESASGRYFVALLSPAGVEHEKDTRYLLRDARGRERTFRLDCVRNGPCTVRNESEQQLRQAVEQMLPPCEAETR